MLEVGHSVHTLNPFFFENHLPTFKQFIYAVNRGLPQKTTTIWRGLDLYEQKKTADMRDAGKKDVKKFEKCSNIFYGWPIMENI